MRWVAPLAAPDHPWDDQPFVVVYGFPTTGKTTAVNFLRSKGIRVWETDAFVLPNGDIDLHCVYRALTDPMDPPDVVFTNLTTDSFPFFVDMKFLRLDHKEVAYLSKLRDGGKLISDRQALGWIEAYLYSPMAKGTILLKEGEFMLEHLRNLVWADERTVI